LDGVDAGVHGPPRAPMGGTAMTTSATFAPLLERFFTDRLMRQRQASPHTVASYRDTFRQLLQFIQQRLHKAPSKLTFEQIDAPLIVGFIDQLEKNEGMSIMSHNLRLSTIHSFLSYVSIEIHYHTDIF